MASSTLWNTGPYFLKYIKYGHYGAPLKDDGSNSIRLVIDFHCLVDKYFENINKFYGISYRYVHTYKVP